MTLESEGTRPEFASSLRVASEVLARRVPGDLGALLASLEDPAEPTEVPEAWTAEIT